MKRSIPMFPVHAQSNELPALIDARGSRVLSKADFGGMVAAYFEVAKGTDLRPLLEGLPGDACSCPHWGYIISGAVHVDYGNGGPAVVEAGEVFYLPPGHTAWFEEDSKLVEFSPEDEHRKVIAHVLSKIG
jgi:hypothetical protein